MSGVAARSRSLLGRKDAQTSPSFLAELRQNRQFRRQGEMLRRWEARRSVSLEDLRCAKSDKLEKKGSETALDDERRKVSRAPVTSRERAHARLSRR